MEAEEGGGFTEAGDPSEAPAWGLRVTLAFKYPHELQAWGLSLVSPSFIMSIQ